MAKRTVAIIGILVVVGLLLILAGLWRSEDYSIGLYIVGAVCFLAAVFIGVLSFARHPITAAGHEQDS